jgi:hypothetical protein
MGRFLAGVRAAAEAGGVDSAPGFREDCRDSQSIIKGCFNLLAVGEQEALDHEVVELAEACGEERIDLGVEALGEFADDSDRLADLRGALLDESGADGVAGRTDFLAQCAVEQADQLDRFSAVDLLVDSLMVRVYHHERLSAFFEVVGQAPEEFRGDLADDFLGFAVDELKDEFIGAAIEGEGQFGGFTEDLGLVDGADGLDELVLLGPLLRAEGVAERASRRGGQVSDFADFHVVPPMGISTGIRRC